MQVETAKTDPVRANKVLDHLIDSLDLKNDAALSRALEVAPPVISKIRHGRLPFGASLLIRAHEISERPIRDLKKMLGQASLKPRPSFPRPT